MFIRAYLRASTDEQDANRAKEELIQFADQKGLWIASFYAEIQSGAKLSAQSLRV
ncbi:recombinase family protein [Shewanella surugensis]|uniref:recombinase family protein n=1 Tax=Shewanella surugensis TaxID=212020 RepID=UPI0035E068A0